MKKIILHLSLSFFGSIVFAQAPANYYDNATGTGFALKTQLKDIKSGKLKPLN